MSFELLLTHFWLFCGLWVGLGGSFMYYFGHRKNITAGIVTEQGVRKFSAGWAAIMVGVAVIFWLLQIASGAATPYYTEWPMPYRGIAIGFSIMLWGLLVAWVFFRNGAATLSMYLNYRKNGFMQIKLTETMVKVFVIVLVVVGLITLSSIFSGAV